MRVIRRSADNMVMLLQILFIVYARCAHAGNQSLPNMARARSARDGPPNRNWLECLPQ